MKIITIASVKGGVGKSTLAINIAISLTNQNYRILAIDLDANNNLTDFFLRNESIDDLENSNVYHFLTKRLSLDKIIRKTEHLDVLPSTLTLNKVGIELALKPASLMRIKPKLKALNYDYIIVDTPPNQYYEMKAGLYISDLVLCPVNFSRWVFQGVNILREELRDVEESIGFIPELKIVPSMVSNSQYQKILDFAKTLPLTNQYISKSESVRTCSDNGIPLRQETKSWHEFNKLSEEVA